MKDIALAWGIGAISGSRSLLAPALVMQARPLPVPVHERPRPPRFRSGRWLMVAAAAAEMIADKTPGIPARTDALPLSGRLASGAAAAAAAAAPGGRVRAAAAGAAGALVASHALYHLRRLMTGRLGLPNAAAGLAEDVFAVGVGVLLMRQRRDTGAGWRRREGRNDPIEARRAQASWPSASRRMSSLSATNSSRSPMNSSRMPLRAASTSSATHRLSRPSE